ncbi:MAG: HAD family phosphatase [Actinomycetota bacterium]|nr:HAD family phosphatase [Actinomycetota bacterium]
MPLALFDLDNTLLQGDSDHAWCEFLIDKGVLEGEAFRQANDRFYREYETGTLDMQEYLAFQLKPLGEHPMEELHRWREEYVATRVEPMISPDALALLEKHRSRGDDLVLVTATNRFVTEPIADRLNVPTLLATEVEEANGRYTGRPTGTPTFREGKVARLEEWLKETGLTLEGSFFYSDSQNDLPLLRRVDHPVAVNPDPVLRAHADEKGWPILLLPAGP